MSLISATLSQLSSGIVEQEASESGRQRSEVLRLVFRNPGKTLDFYKKHVDVASQKQVLRRLKELANTCLIHKQLVRDSRGHFTQSRWYPGKESKKCSSGS